MKYHKTYDICKITKLQKRIHFGFACSGDVYFDDGIGLWMEAATAVSPGVHEFKNMEGPARILGENSMYIGNEHRGLRGLRVSQIGDEFICWITNSSFGSSSWLAGKKIELEVTYLRSEVDGLQP